MAELRVLWESLVHSGCLCSYSTRVRERCDGVAVLLTHSLLALLLLFASALVHFPLLFLRAQYDPSCTEGSAKGHAEASRKAALSAAFRANHRSSAQKVGDYFETRCRALTVAGGCSYEEYLVGRFPAAASAVVLGAAEANRTCVRYGVPSSPAEAYMVRSVDAAMKRRAVSSGVYEPSCSDGGSSGEAEFKRVQALAAKYRSAAVPAGAAAQSKYDSAAYARKHFGHGCSYEDNLFGAYPAMAAAMRPSTARY